MWPLQCGQRHAGCSTRQERFVRVLNGRSAFTARKGLTFSKGSHHGDKEAIRKDTLPQGQIGTCCRSLNADIFNCLWQLGEHDCDGYHIWIGPIVFVRS